MALVGYTNAGKSSLMRALTGSEVLVADKLFATLDTTVRALFPETVPRILVSDTVGFIKKLPHDLVASFRSTLDEARFASLILNVVDASDANFPSQREVTLEALSEIGATDVPQILVLNKIDQLSPSQIAELKNIYKDAAFISTRRPEDITQLKQRVTDFFERDMREETLLLPYNEEHGIGFVRKEAKVLSENYTDAGIELRVKGEARVLDRIAKKTKAKRLSEQDPKSHTNKKKARKPA